MLSPVVNLPSCVVYRTHNEFARIEGAINIFRSNEFQTIEKGAVNHVKHLCTTNGRCKLALLG